MSLNPKTVTISLFVLLVVALTALASCSQFPDSVSCTTGKSYTPDEIRSMFPDKYILFADQSYSEVNPAFSGAKWHDYTGSVMNLLGMAPNWSQQFDCNRFALVKLAVIHARFLIDTWHSRKPSEAVAAGECWYIRGMASGSPGGHAIIVTIENGRPAFRDIYSEKQLFLTKQEMDSIFLLKF